MINIEDFFKLINLDLSKELIQLNLNFRKNPSLFEKAKNNIYRYIPENEKTHCVFTVFDIPELSDDEVYEIREYIWNENKSDLLFLHHQNKLDLIYSFSDPSSPPIIIDTFSGNEEDNVLIEKIGKSNFDTGLFWEIYYDVREVIRKERVTVDRSLIKTLQILRQKLQTIYNDIISDVDKRDEIIQALIDRTLFIKFMEDKHIINSFFYNHYFENGDNYISFLRSNKKNELNNLFSLINNIFNNTLFENPYIPNKHLVNPALSIIADALERKNLETGQLSLFGYHFDVIPNEFIGHVYEMFFDESQSEEGIFYTPRGLAKLIVDETIEMTGKVLDPSCGSGVFLVLALKKLFENENLLYNVSVEDISKRNKILAENIYGIEKQANARRLTILSLYLELLDGVDPNELEEYINNKIELGEDFKIFPYDFTSNILHGNALSISSINGVENFEYIIGNPPFLEIKTGEEEEDFWKKHSDKISNKQLSQCFFIKMHEWSCQNTKFGFVSNLSNFDSDSSIKFQLYFYEKYSISQFFNLAEIKSILFENANESTAVIIFSINYKEQNEIKFFAPKLTGFAKSFNVVLLKDSDKIKINQASLYREELYLKDFFTGDIWDQKLTQKIYSHCTILADYLIENPCKKTGYAVNNGIQILGSKNQPENWKVLSKVERKKIKDELINKYSRELKDERYQVPFLNCANMEPFQMVKNYRYYEQNIESLKEIFERVRSNNEFMGERILFPRTGIRLKALHTNFPVYYCFDIFSIQLKESNLYPLFVAILNSDLINYCIMIRHRKRVTDSFPKISMNDVIQFPIPILYDKKLEFQISEISRKISRNEVNYTSCKDELNKLIFDLYGLNEFERQKVTDYFMRPQKVTVCQINEYINSFISLIKPHISSDIVIRGYKYIDKKLSSSFVGVKFLFTRKEEEEKETSLSIDKVVNYSLFNLIREIGNVNIYTTKEMIYSKNNVFFIRENNIRLWSKSKAYEDARIFLNDLFK